MTDNINDLRRLLKARFQYATTASIKDTLRFTFFVMNDRPNNGDFLDRIKRLRDIPNVKIYYTVSHSKCPLSIFKSLIFNEGLIGNYRMFYADVPIPLEEKESWIAKLALRLYTHSNIIDTPQCYNFKFLDTCSINTLLAGNLAKCDPDLIQRECTIQNLGCYNLFCFEGASRCDSTLSLPYHFHFSRNDIKEMPFPGLHDDILELDYIAIEGFCFWATGNDNNYQDNPLKHVLLEKFNYRRPNIMQTKFEHVSRQTSEALKEYQKKYQRTVVYHLLVVTHPTIRPTVDNLEHLWADDRSKFGVYTGCTSVDTEYRLSLFTPNYESSSISKCIDENAEVFLLGYDEQSNFRYNVFRNYKRARLVEAIRIEIIKIMFERKNTQNRRTQPIPINIRSEYIPLLTISKIELDSLVNSMLSDINILDLRIFGENQPALQFNEDHEILEAFPGPLRVIRQIEISHEFRQRCIDRQSLPIN